MDTLIEVDSEPFGRRIRLRAIPDADAPVVVRRIAEGQDAVDIRYADGRYWIPLGGGLPSLKTQLKNIGGARADWIAKASEILSVYLDIGGVVHSVCAKPVLLVSAENGRVKIEAVAATREQAARAVFRADRMDAALAYARTLAGTDPVVRERYAVVDPAHFRDPDAHTLWERQEEFRLLAVAESLVMETVPAVAALSRAEQVEQVRRVLSTILDGASAALGWSNHDRMKACSGYAAGEES